MVQVTRSTKFTGICIGIYVSYAIFVFFLLPMMLPDPVTLQRAIVGFQTRHLGNLTNYTMETGGQPVRSLLVTFRGSGALSLLDSLSHQPGCYHHYAPLVSYQSRSVAEQNLDRALDELINLYYCNYNQSENMLRSGMRSSSFRRFYGVQWKTCMTYSHELCWDTDTIAEICKLYPFINMSVYNLRLKYLAALLEREDLNLRIMLLVRDPRGTMHSRSNRSWCAGNPECDEARFLCRDMVSDYQVAKSLVKSHPDRFGFVRFEDLTLHPARGLQQVFGFFGLPIKRLRDEHTGHPRSIKGSEADGTQNLIDMKFLDQRAFEWMSHMPITQIKAVQDNPHCKEALEFWGYSLVNSFKDFKPETFEPLLAKPTFEQ